MLPVLLTALLAVALQAVAAQAGDDRPRLLVLTDIGGDPDDQQSLIRLMLYSNEFQIDGLIATASGTPGELKKAVTRPDLIRQIVEAYGQVRPNLSKHASGYPSVEAHSSRIVGKPRRGLEFIGEKHDTEGSNGIIRAADDPDTRPLNVTIWGGQTDFAQALWRVRNDRDAAGLRAFLARLRVYDIDDQDRLQPWIFENFPDLFYLLAKAPSKHDKREGAYRGMYLGGDESLTSRAWLDEHVRKTTGLSAHSTLRRRGPIRTRTCAQRGDTPSWFFFAHRPQRPAQPTWEAGVDVRHVDRGLARCARSGIRFSQNQTDPRASVGRWRPVFQHDFQVRLDWCVQDVEKANHSPEVFIEDAPAHRPVLRSAKSSQPVTITAGASDRDGDALAYRWWIYTDAGTYAKPVTLQNANTASVTIDVPADASGQTLHLILETTDTGTPALTTLVRMVLRVE
jgi:hypothetical protein